MAGLVSARPRQPGAVMLGGRPRSASGAPRTQWPGGLTTAPLRTARQVGAKPRQPLRIIMQNGGAW
jgi:hypothetical protein